jgi:methylmalonyl-CoA carboxyltransferase large subunit
MKPESTNWTEVKETLAALRQELGGLRERVAALERGPHFPDEALEKFRQILEEARHYAAQMAGDTLARVRADFQAEKDRLKGEIKKASDRAVEEIWTAAAGLVTAPPKEPTPAPPAEGLSDEMVLVIGAAVAAFLGKKAPIRQIRLLGSAAWAQQGRVTIQASHNL